MCRELRDETSCQISVGTTHELPEGRSGTDIVGKYYRAHGGFAGPAAPHEQDFFFHWRSEYQGSVFRAAR